MFGIIARRKKLSFTLFYFTHDHFQKQKPQYVCAPMSCVAFRTFKNQSIFMSFIFEICFPFFLSLSSRHSYFNLSIWNWFIFLTSEWWVHINFDVLVDDGSSWNILSIKWVSFCFSFICLDHFLISFFSVSFSHSNSIFFALLKKFSLLKLHNFFLWTLCNIVHKQSHFSLCISLTFFFVSSHQIHTRTHLRAH